MANSKIEWTDRVWNPVTGCTKISEGCQNCYAERMSKRFAETWGLPADNPFGVRLHPERLEEPLRWSKPSRIFVCSMGDLFHEEVPFQFIHQIWGVMKKCPKHTFIVLTKRPERMKQVVNRIYSLERLGWAKGFWEHVWLGLTAENQKRAEERIPILLQIPAAVRFVSLEPMLGPVSFRWFPAWPENAPTVAMNPYNKGITNEYDGLRRLDWIICGGESGPGARPMHPDWARSLRDQCTAANVPFFFKQWGEWGQVPSNKPPKGKFGCWRSGRFYIGEGYNEEVYPGTINMQCLGKKNTGRELDGQIWDQYPEVVV